MLCSVNAKLSVGARALSKHCHRDDSLKWWGKCTGCKLTVPFIDILSQLVIITAEEEKNRHALDRVVTILREAAWINIHSLPVSSIYDTVTLPIYQLSIYNI